MTSTSKELRPYELPLKVQTRGATAMNGRPYVGITASQKCAWIPRAAFAGNGTSALRMLNHAGMPFLAEEWGQCRALVARLTSYPLTPLIDRSGWNPPHFALCDGTVFSPSGGDKPVVLFPGNPHKCANRGSITRWRNITAKLAGQHIPTFIMLAAYASPLLALSHQISNIGFELAGPGGRGKSTVQRLAAAVSGPADSPLGANYWITANATMNGLEDVLVEHRDMPLIIEEANLFAAGDHQATRAAKFNELVFRLADGSGKRRYGEAALPRSRFVFVTSSNESLAEVLAGRRVAVAEAAADRLLTIPVADDRPHGIFEFIPPKYDDGAGFAEFFNRQVRKCYGVGIRRFLECLVVENATEPGDLASDIQRSIEQFRDHAGVDKNDGSATRVADSFGLVAAAGNLAVRFGAISRAIDPLGAALACYKLNRACQMRDEVDYEKKLRQLAGHFDAIWVDARRFEEWTDSQIENAPCIVREGFDGTEELLMTTAQIRRAFPDQRSFFAHPTVRRWLIAEEGRRQTKRQIRANRGQERVHCFRIPSLS